MKVSIWYSHLYSSTQPEFFKTNCPVIYLNSLQEKLSGIVF